jgi:hypothetical protein
MDDARGPKSCSRQKVPPGPSVCASVQGLEKMGNGGSDWGRVGLQAKYGTRCGFVCGTQFGHSAAEAFIKAGDGVGTESNEVNELDGGGGKKTQAHTFR